MRRKKPGLTNRQSVVFDEFCRFNREHGRVPMQAELAEKLSLSLSTVHNAIQALAEQKYLKRYAAPRRYEVARELDDSLRVEIPILGLLKQDRVVLFDPPALGGVSIVMPSPEEAANAGEYYALRVVQGGTLTFSSCSEGGVVVLRRRAVPGTGNTVIASINGTKRLCKLKLSNDFIVVVSEGGATTRLRPSDQLTVDGVMMLSFSPLEAHMV